jgi:prepilin-type N-terminal cleavage/methylation domain-containing protein
MGQARVEHDEQGFSLVELMTVVLIMGILVAVAVASFTVTAESSRRVACMSNQRTLRGAVLQYQVEHSGILPDTLDDVREEVNWQNGWLQCTSSTALLGYSNVTGDVWCDTAGHELP